MTGRGHEPVQREPARASLAGRSDVQYAERRARCAGMVARPRFHRVAAWAVAAAVLVGNPLFGLGAEEPHFGAKELRAAVEGTWRLTVRMADGAEQGIAFTIAQGGAVAGTHASNRALVQPAAACGTRTLVKPAGACADETYMPLEVTLLVPWAQRRQEPGELMVEGTRFQNGYLSVSLASVRVSATILPNGRVQSVSSHSDDHPGLSSTLVRISR